MMKRMKSGALKRKEAATERVAIAGLPKVTDFFKVVETTVCRPCPDTEMNEVNINDGLALVQEVSKDRCEQSPRPSCDANTTNLPLVSKNGNILAIALQPNPVLNPISDAPSEWPAKISNPQRCNIVKGGPQQLVINFSYNDATPKRRFSSVHHKRVLANGESVPRPWLFYSETSDKVFCFCCKLFGNTLSPFCNDINTWEGFSKKLEDHENLTIYQKCCSQRMLLDEGMKNLSTIDKHEMKIFLIERSFWRNVLERLIDVILYLSQRNFAFRWSEEESGSPRNGNFLGLFELLAKKVPILKELQNRIKHHKTKDHCLNATIH